MRMGPKQAAATVYKHSLEYQCRKEAAVSQA